MDVMGQNGQLPAGVAVAFSADRSLACIRFTGNLDSNSWRLLADLHAQLSLPALRRILCDLATTTFAGVSLMAFFARRGLIVEPC